MTAFTREQLAELPRCAASSLKVLMAFSIALAIMPMATRMVPITAVLANYFAMSELTLGSTVGRRRHQPARTGDGDCLCAKRRK